MIPVRDPAYANPFDLLLDVARVLGADETLKKGDVDLSPNTVYLMEIYGLFICFWFLVDVRNFVREFSRV